MAKKRSLKYIITLMISNNHIAFLYGVLVNIVDDMNDYKTMYNLKLGFETILAILTFYILYFTNKLGFVTSVLFSFGGLLYVLFASHVLGPFIFRLITLLAIPPMLYHISQNIQYVQDNLYFLGLLCVSSVIAGILILLEDKMVPEEFSYRKIGERAFQLILAITILVYIHKLQLTENQMSSISWVVYGWIGYTIANIATMIYLMSCTDLSQRLK